MDKKEEQKHILRHEITYGERASDSLTRFAGSWLFIFSFLIFMIIWISINVYMWRNQWDPYPFILLNLILSCLAAIQAPIILMSQNREEQKNKIRLEYDYHVNRKAEREIQQVQKQLERIERKLR
ncbi:MAG: DUF1003 domain-containing protein [Nanoarchaeota archaeon]|nr:DUF1003 domain-containing protein [Nanoarchaeota archaeon]